MSKRLEFINSVLVKNERFDFQVIREEYDHNSDSFIEVDYDVSYLLDGHEFDDVYDVLEEIGDAYPEEFKEIMKKISKFDEENKPKIEEYKESLKSDMDTEKYNIIVNIDYVSSDGMVRLMNFVMCYIDEDNHFKAYNATSLIAEILDYPTSSKNSLVVRGSGMDMVFHVISSLSKALYGDSYKIDGLSNVTLI